MFSQGALRGPNQLEGTRQKVVLSRALCIQAPGHDL